MSLREELTQLQVGFGNQMSDRRRERAEVQSARDKEDFETGKKHGLEDLDGIVAYMKQLAAQGADQVEIDVDESRTTSTTSYALGYFEALYKYFGDHNVGCYPRSNSDKSNTNIVKHRIQLYWR